MSTKVTLNIDWNKIQEKMVEEIDKRVIIAFKRACYKAVTYAKTNHEYTQQTGALNSSTGFQLYKDGVLIDELFEESNTGSDKDGAKAKGATAGKNVASERALQLGAHACAVIVAGMPYAIFVESKGFDVLTATEKQFPAMLEKQMNEAFKNENIDYSITT